MDPYAPINGISLERYAELGAELDGITDPDAQAEKVASLGVQRADWEAATKGWTARMQDMSLMGAVATRYMPLYNAALAKKKGNASLSFEDFVAVSAAIPVFGYEAAMAHFKISMGDWTTISAHWNMEMSKDPMNMGMRKNQMQEAETARLRAGGQPKPVTISRSAPGAAVAGGAGAFDPNAHAAHHMAAGQQQVNQWQAYSAGVLASDPNIQRAINMAAGMAQVGGGTGLIVGRQVLVQWSDGNKYPGTIMQTNGVQAQVSMQNGQSIWVETRYLTAK